MQEISFTKRISKLKKDKLIVIVPKDRLDDFEHKDLIKATLLKTSEEITFTKRISKLKEDKLIVIIPKDRLDDFNHKGLVKIELIKKWK